MQEILFLLLPLAFYSGWHAAHERIKKQKTTTAVNDEKPTPRFVQGINFLLNEEPDKALDVFLESPALDGQMADTFLSLGNMFRNRGEVNRALRVHQHLVARPDLNTQQRQAAMLALGEDFFAAGLLDRAESVFREMIAKYPKNIQAREPLRHIYEQLQDWNKAIKLSEDSNSAAEQGKNRLIAHYYCELVENCLKQNQLYQAEENLKHALSAYPESARVQILQAELALSRGERKVALVYFLQGIKQDGRLLGALIGRLLEIFDESDELAYLYKAVNDLYQQHDHNTLFFPALLSIAQASGHQKDTLKLIEVHLQQDKLSLQTVARSAFVLTQNKVPADRALPLLDTGLMRLVKANTRFQCMHCGYKMHDYLWRCPACHQWDAVQNA